MTFVVTASEMAEKDRHAIETLGIPGMVLMENAGRRSAEIAMEMVPDRNHGRVCILCGPGNNGGDGFVIARHLLNYGYRADSYIVVSRDKIRGDALANLEILEKIGAPLVFVNDADEIDFSRYDLIVDALLSSAGDSGPYMMMTLIFFLTAGIGLVLSNTASAVLVAPIAIYLAAAIGVSPYPFAVAVLIAASAAYSTPVSTPVVTLVVDPGRYKFMDFVKVGVPLLLVTYLVTLLVAPLVFPFGVS